MCKPYWTEQAIDCYNIGCMCSKCLVNDILNGKCQMKKVVFNLVKTIGKPPKTKDERLNIEEIKEWLKEGLTILQIARRYQIDEKKLRHFNHSHGLYKSEIYKIKKEGKSANI